ncbi:hypothetical protein J2Z22_003648 [Paenibacillus forsythiae]|uniref:Transposase n=1 Tax=Paenibacillus forsythiae TaxID=365616 RepID=A0ABU3HB69_9BACL|nr:hypothetical protein [Paenibacillus forsythiae]
MYTIVFWRGGGMLFRLKQELAWLSEVDSTALQSALKHLADAYKQFFTKRNNAPCFKRKKNPVQSYTTQIQEKSQSPEVSIAERRIKLPKLGWVKFAQSREVTLAHHPCHPPAQSFGKILCIRACGNRSRGAAENPFRGGD